MSTINDSPQVIFDEMEELNNKLNETGKELSPLVHSVAEKERDYNILFAQVTLQKKADGLPVTLIKDIVKGNRGVADAKMQLYLAEQFYKITIEKMKDIRSRIEQQRSKLTWKRMEISNANM